MKKIYLLLVVLFLQSNVFSQMDGDSWYLSFGINAVNNLGTRSPFNSPGDWYFNSVPATVSAEINYLGNFSIEPSLSYNNIKSGESIDGVQLDKDYDYIALDMHVKYYFGKFLLPRSNRIELYANAGIGFFHIDETNISANVGGGLMFWLTEKKNIALRAQTIGKFAFNHPKSGFDNNHFLYNLQLVFKMN